MNDHRVKGSAGNDARPFGADGGFLEFVRVFKEVRTALIVNVVVVTIAALIISLLLPPWFKSTASILPPKEGPSLSTVGLGSSVLRGVTGLGKIGGLSESAILYNYMAILKSRTVSDHIVRRFDLVNVYKVDELSVEKAIKELADNVSFEIQNEDYLTIEVFDKDATRAAAMANAFVEELNTISLLLSTQEARNNRVFIEQRLERVREDLRKAEDALREFQQKNRVLIVPDEKSSGLSAVAELYALREKKSLEVSILRRSLQSDNASLQTAELELAEMDKRIAGIPTMGVEGVRLLRDVMVQQRILEVIIPLYEQAKVDEQRDVPVMLLLDKAVPAEKKAKPKRLFVVLSGFGLSIIGGAGYLLWRMGMKNLRRSDPAAHAELLGTFDGLWNDMRQLVSRRRRMR